MEGGPKRRCVIKKLDFENCIVTNIPTKTRRRRQLRARITREVEDTDRRRQMTPPRESSPVLMTKPPTGSQSPVLLTKKRFRDEGGQGLSQKETPTSPVFKLTNKLFTSPFDTKTTISDTLTLDSNSYRIDDSTQESNQNVDISSVDTERVNKPQSPGNYSIDTRSDTDTSCRWSDLVKAPEEEEEEKFQNTGRLSRRNYKKNSLLGRLQKLLQKQASEKLLWQHQNKRNLGSSVKKLSVDSIWNREGSFFVKCWSESEVVILVVDSLWVPAVKRVKEGSVLKLHPPWQTMSLEGSSMTVLLNIICLEILQETETERRIQKREILQSSPPTNEFLTKNKLFLESLFSSQLCGLLC